MAPAPAIYARNCTVRRLDKVAAAGFFDRYHRLGSAACRHCYGLFVERTTGSAELTLAQGTLVAAAGFSGARRWHKGERTVASYEWVRYASIEGLRVVGGMSKLLQAFVDEKRPDDVMSYADPLSPDGGKAYEKLGFIFETTVEKPGFSCRKYRKVYP